MSQGRPEGCRDAAGDGAGRPAQVAARVRSIWEAAPRTRLLWLEAGGMPVPAPGQFVMVRCGQGPEPLLRRPLSIHSVDGRGGLALLFETVGRGTAWLADRAPGDPVDLIGPLGHGFTIPAGSREILLVAGGIGIAPLAFLAETAAAAGLAVRLLQGARTASLLCPRTGGLPEDAVVRLTDDGSCGRKGMVTGLLGELAPRAGAVFACGPVAMYRAMAGLECLRGKPVQLSLEERMACGLGACYGCTVRTRSGPRQVCRDGPVFDMSQILW